MGNSSTKLAEKCNILSKDEVPIVASSFKLVSKNSERIKEDDLMVSYSCNNRIFALDNSLPRKLFTESIHVCNKCLCFRNFGFHKWTRV